MKKIKSFLSRFKDQRGIGVVGVLLIVGAVVLTAGLFSFGYETIERQKTMEDVTKYADPDYKGDPNEAAKKNKAAVVKSSVAGGKVAVSIYDDTGLLTLADKAGAFDIPEEDKTKEQKEKEAEKNRIKEERDRRVEEKLKENNLPTDPLTKDTYKSVEDITSENISSDATEEDKDRVTTNIVEELVNKDPEKIETKDSFEVLNSIKEELDENKILENEIIIEKRSELIDALLDKEILEKEIEAYEYYEKWGIVDESEYVELIERLDNVNEKISDTEKELSLIEEQETTEEEIEVEQKGSITLKGASFGKRDYPMSITINLDTGDVSGRLRYEGPWTVEFTTVYEVVNEKTGEVVDTYTETDTIECPVVFEGTISGHMELETKDISATFSGTLHPTATSGECSTLPDKPISFTLSGKLSEDNSYASGTDSDGYSWSVYR